MSELVPIDGVRKDPEAWVNFRTSLEESETPEEFASWQRSETARLAGTCRL
jgi:hypothetical protein